MRDAVYSGFFFFFQAEDGIRDLTVTGVQTCALPISPLRLTIHRDPAPWKSWWACIAYALAALAALAYRVRLQRLRFQRVVSARQRLESEVELRTRELTESNRQLADAVQAKSNFPDRIKIGRAPCRE